MTQLIKHIKLKYRIDVDTFKNLYGEGLSRKELAEYFGVTESAIRSTAGLLGLRLSKIYRAEDLVALETRLNKKEDTTLTEVLKDNELLSKELYQTKSKLQYVRDKVNLLNREIREAYRFKNGYEYIGEIFKEYLKDTQINNIKVEYNKEVGKTIICLSDLHIGALVDNNSILNQNKYNFEIAKKRILKVIQEGLKYENDELHIVILGDVFDGLIHNSHLIAESPVMKAVVDFNNWFTSVLNGLQKAYNTQIKISIVSGNHERLTDDQQLYKKGYDFTYIFSEMLKASNPNINIEYFIQGYGLIELGGNNYGFIFHGDIDRGYRPSNLNSVIKLMTHCKNFFNIEPKLMLSGHTHTYNKGLLPNGGVAITIGSLIGQNEYAFNKGFITMPPVQSILSYTKDGELISEQIVNLKDIND